MPLVYLPGMESKASERQRKARKIKPQYSEGQLVKVAYASNQPEAELIEALLLEEGIPSLSRRAGGFDVPDFLAAGPRDILVPESGAEAAREALAPEVAPEG
jgi:Putative prokaryotic signal transducing protein